MWIGLHRRDGWADLLRRDYAFGADLGKAGWRYPVFADEARRGGDAVEQRMPGTHLQSCWKFAGKLPTFDPPCYVPLRRVVCP